MVALFLCPLLRKSSIILFLLSMHTTIIDRISAFTIITASQQELVSINMKKIFALILCFAVVSCGGDNKPNKIHQRGLDKEYPMAIKDGRELKRGRLTGDDGIALVGGNASSLNRGFGSGFGGDSISRGVNAYLWQASLDTISFMPIATVDATGGVIITDWYEDPASRGEKIKANVVISSDELRASGVKVSLFRQVGGKSAPASDELARSLEDKILIRARQLRIDDNRL